MAKKAIVTHVIFDMDGLLLDTEKYYTQVQEVILARFNKTFDWDLKAKMMGKKAIESARIFVEESGISDSLTPEEFLLQREDLLRTLFPNSDIMPGNFLLLSSGRDLLLLKNGHSIETGRIEGLHMDTIISRIVQLGAHIIFSANEALLFGASRLIRHLHEKGIPMAVATGSTKRHFELKTQRHKEIFSLMHHIVNGEDPEVKLGKPAPDVFLAAAKRFEGGPVDPGSALIFEDAPAGVNAGKNAGMHVVMVPDPRLDSSLHERADQVLKSLLDFNPAEWGLPPFESEES